LRSAGLGTLGTFAGGRFAGSPGLQTGVELATNVGVSAADTIAQGGDTTDVLRSATINIATAGALHQGAGHQRAQQARELRGRQIGEDIRARGRVGAARVRQATLAIGMGITDVAPPFRPGIGGQSPMAAEAATLGPTIERPVGAQTEASVRPSAGDPTQQQTTTQRGSSQQAQDRAASRRSGVERQAPRQAGEEVWDEINAEIGLEARSASTSRDPAGAARDAEAGGLMGARGAPGTVDLAVQPHSSASDVRGAFQVSGSDVQSAHIGPTSFLRRVVGYSRGAADTVLMDAATHRAFDAHWKNWAIARRRAGETQCTVRELHDVMRQSIDQIPGLPQRTRDTIAWRLELEFRDLGLSDSTILDLPYPNIRPPNAP
jgi:hypothetical protein